MSKQELKMTDDLATISEKKESAENPENSRPNLTDQLSKLFRVTRGLQGFLERIRFRM